MPVTFHPAPWSRFLKVVSTLATALCLGVGLTLARRGGLEGWIPAVGMAALIFGCLLFTIRGYSIAGDAILVRRLLWTTRVPLAGLVSAAADPEAMRHSIRMFGNGGLFSFTGHYRNEHLGRYRAYVMDPARSVVLRFADRTFVISPATPQDFVRELETSGVVRPG